VADWSVSGQLQTSATHKCSTLDLEYIPMYLRIGLVICFFVSCFDIRTSKLQIFEISVLKKSKVRSFQYFDLEESKLLIYYNIILQ